MRWWVNFTRWPAIRLGVGEQAGGMEATQSLACRRVSPPREKNGIVYERVSPHYTDAAAGASNFCRWFSPVYSYFFHYTEQRFAVITTMFTARCDASAVFAVMQSVRLSARPSVTFVDHVKTNKHILEIFSQSGSYTILVFLYQSGCRYSDGNPPNGGECKGV